jgi:hypothetical protein
VDFYVAPAAARIVLKTAPRGPEGVIDGQAKILVRRLDFELLPDPFFAFPPYARTQVGLTLYDQFAAG